MPVLTIQTVNIMVQLCLDAVDEICSEYVTRHNQATLTYREHLRLPKVANTTSYFDMATDLHAKMSSTHTDLVASRHRVYRMTHRDIALA